MGYALVTPPAEEPVTLAEAKLTIKAAVSLCYENRDLVGDLSGVSSLLSSRVVQSLA